MLNAIKSWFVDSEEQRLRAYQKQVHAINALSDSMRALSDDDLRARYQNLRQQCQNGSDVKTLMNETFAVVREAAMRTLNMRHFDVQLVGGMALFDGKIAEMKTGEGKTLVATLAVCLECLTGKGVHVVTVNDYLAQRDAAWMGQLYEFLGLTVGVNIGGLTDEQKKQAYDADVTYGTNNEFGFDYLRHNMRYTPEGVQRPLNFAIVDEVDSILIDESRTPLIISGESNESVAVYEQLAAIAKNFKRASGEGSSDGDFVLDEKARTVQLTDDGFDRAEQLFAEAGLMNAEDSLYESAQLPLLHHLDVALRARHLFIRDRDYVVQAGKVVIVDEFTGRLMHGRRWGDNQHQAVEAKEGVAVQKESQTLASTSFQNYFRLYARLAGMTGTAKTESEEFNYIYGLQVFSVPPHRSMIRRDELDKVFRTAQGKEQAIMNDIRESHTRAQPVLVGTTSIEMSEHLSQLLQQENIPHHVLNAKQHEHEASIIAQSGMPRAITIATNMAGRGTDIVLGGNITDAKQAIVADESLSESEQAEKLSALETEWQKNHEAVAAAGGLRVIGTERHESRRIDNQLRGRSGRQGDPGSSIFYLSFEDSLLRIFATRHVTSLMEKMNMEEDEAIEAKMVSRTIENAQRKVESHNFDIRRQLLEYDDITNEQRQLIYQQREDILNAEDILAVAKQFRTEHLAALMDEHIPADTPEEQWQAEELQTLLEKEYRLSLPLANWIANESQQPREYFVDKLITAAEAEFERKFEGAQPEPVARFIRSLILNVIDENWRGQLSALEHLRLSIGLRGMAQKNPKQEYKRESFNMFNRLLTTIQTTIVRVLYALQVNMNPTPAADGMPPDPAAAAALESTPAHTDAIRTALPKATPAPNPVAAAASARVTNAPQTKVRRNAPCPCGSGKKYKQCCGKL